MEINKLNKIDYELRNMKMPFLNDAPLASSYAEKSGYAVLSDDTYFTIKDDFSNATGNAVNVPALEQQKYDIEKQLTEVDSDILSNSDEITKYNNLLNKAVTERNYRQSKYDDALKLYNEINSVKNKNRREEKLKEDRRKELDFQRDKLNVSKASILSHSNTLISLNSEDTRLKNLKSGLIQQKAELIDAISKGKSREILANKGTTPEAKQESDKILAEGKRSSDILKAQADAIQVKSSSRGKLLLIVGGIGLVGLIAMLVLRRN
jgi:chromosome segregation ATPase